MRPLFGQRKCKASGKGIKERSYFTFTCPSRILSYRKDVFHRKPVVKIRAKPHRFLRKQLRFSEGIAERVARPATKVASLTTKVAVLATFLEMPCQKRPKYNRNFTKAQHKFNTPLSTS